MTLRAVIADDHPLFREGLRTLLTDLGVQIVAEAADGAEALIAVRNHQPDVIFMDLRMPVLNGVEATRRISSEWPGVTVLVLTMSEDAASLQAALAAGARGYLLKEAGKDDVRRALDAVTRGEVVVGAGAARQVRTALRNSQRGSPFPQLSDRELEVLELLARGLSNNAIAQRLFLAEKTVRNRVSVVLAKLEAPSRSAAIAIARDAGIGVD
jgi:DNA-binding NarL/FixJ family response regulator